MKRVMSDTGLDKPINSETVGELTALYDNFAERLRECADFRPVGNEAQDLAVEAMENKLFDLQEEVVKRASKITLRNKRDIKDLLDFWHVATVQNAPDEVSISDRIIMNIRDYFDEAVLEI